MIERVGPLQPSPAQGAWWRRVGRRNLAYVAFVVSLVPIGMILEGSGPGGPDRGGGIMAALLLGGIGSVAFILVNAVLVVVALVQGQAVKKPLFACVVPIAVIGGILMFENIL
jgi:hypothetical protein